MNRQDDTENYLHKRAIPTQTLALSQNYPASQPQASRALPGAPSPAAPVRTNVLNFRNGAQVWKFQMCVRITEAQPQ